MNEMKDRFETKYSKECIDQWIDRTRKRKKNKSLEEINNVEVTKKTHKNGKEETTDMMIQQEMERIRTYPENHSGPATVVTFNSESGRIEWIPSESVVLTFEADTIPDKIQVYGLYFMKVEVYIELVKICYNCYKVGHTAKFCKNKKICRTCGDGYHEDKIECPKKSIPFCVQCNEEHLMLSSKCNTFIYNKDLNIIMATKNISIYEARREARAKSTNSMRSTNNNNDNVADLTNKF
ncbi:hypothetical protein KPH14_011857 [Odynerus spinipes]|uniref:CCHC-type domain-containing protein n=1 Tax=Odynerus spinipes TaxID=1348599 RepID=A0AAD9RDY7_9HYME|nr:hypothetical protein KPH14_011857 [Odynerus spinipes]